MAVAAQTGLKLVGPSLAQRIAAKLSDPSAPGAVPALREEERQRRAWIESNFVIRNKDRQLQRLRLNYPQEQLWRRWEAQRFRGVRDVILKARQEGVSTLCLAAAFEEVTRVPNTHAAVVDRDADQVHRKLRVLRLAYRLLPEDLRPRIASPQTTGSKNEMEFPDLNSSIYVGKAGARNFGRGDTLHVVLLSEFAFYPDPETLLDGILEAVPLGQGMVFVESTANGAGTAFHTEYADARDGKSGRTAYFLPWHAMPDYRVPPAAGEPKLVLDERESKLRERYKLDDDQIRFYRQKKKDLGDKIEQEYPSDDESAFLRSGRVRFDVDRLVDISAGCVEPKTIEDSGALRIYEEPQPGRTYTLAADAAEGVVGGDADAAVVVDDVTGIEVATLHGWWPLHVYADKLMALGRRYNTAMLAVERNNHGHAVLQRIAFGMTSEGIEPYQPNRIYRHVSIDAKTRKPESRIGWPTDQIAKPLMATALERLIADHPECFRDKATVNELLTCVYLDGPEQWGAPAGAHDDRVIARAIAEQVRPISLAAGDGAPSISGVIRYGGRRGRADAENYRDPRGE